MDHTEPCIVLGGTRGSMPVSHPDVVRYGGASTSVLVDGGDGARVLIDAGTGLQTLAPSLGKQAPEGCPLLLLLTHYHLDHLIGLPSFQPLYDPAFRLTVAAPPCDGVGPEEPVRRLTSPPFWPVPWRAHCDFVTLPAILDTPFRHGPFDIRWCAVHHANGCHAYRIEERRHGVSMVFATDVEWGRSSPTEQAALRTLCRTPTPVGVLLMDGHEDTAAHPGWGHSTWQEAVGLARETGAGQLVVIHLAPGDDDATLTTREERLRAMLPSASLGRQGQAIPWKKGPPNRASAPV